MPVKSAGKIEKKWKLDVLDGDCGTGLCAPILKPYASRLTGVDLSAGMMVRAKKTKLYEELVESELTAYLTKHPAAFNLAVFSDTLCYFGDLEEVITATAGALREMEMGQKVTGLIVSARIRG